MSRSAFDLSTDAAQSVSLRSQGPLSSAALAQDRQDGAELAFDPVQGGWVRADCSDDLAQSKEALAHSGYGFRDWRAEDAPELARMLSEPALWRYLPDGNGGAVDTAGAESLIEIARDEADHWVQAVTLHGRVIGQARVQHPRSARAEVSYWFDRSVRGKGHGRAVIGRFTAKVFARFARIEALFARVHRDNHASRRLVERLGYREASKRSDNIWQVFERKRRKVLV